MKIQGIPRRAIEPLPGRQAVQILDQTLLPHQIEWCELNSMQDTAIAIQTMQVRGAPLIGATAAFGLFFALRDDPSDTGLATAFDTLFATRPTAVNLRWALERVRGVVAELPAAQRAETAWNEALQISEDDVAANAALGRCAQPLLEKGLAAKTDKTLNVMTHCNAGWLATVDWGTALSPVYQAHENGMKVHVWVSETRPRNQGASLTAWELGQHQVPHTLIVDNAAGHLIQRGLVDLIIVGADRVTAAGDVANKIGTYLKALAAKAHNVPFYVAVPVSTIDWTIEDGVRDIPIEQRSSREVTHLAGRTEASLREEILITPETTPARNDAFDVTPAHLVTGLITEHCVIPATKEALAVLAQRLR
jgi:methylthioribose-1-phosphate isomerase